MVGVLLSDLTYLYFFFVAVNVMGEWVIHFIPILLGCFFLLSSFCLKL